MEFFRIYVYVYMYACEQGGCLVPEENPKKVSYLSELKLLTVVRQDMCAGNQTQILWKRPGIFKH